MLSKAKLGPGRWPYYCNGVMVGDGHRPAGKPLRDAQDEAGVPPGFWTGRGLAAVGLTAGDEVTERQAELLLGEGRHPDADRIEAELLAAGDDPVKARRATVLGRPIEHIKGPHIESPWLAMDLVFRAPSTAQSAWALVDDATRRVLELCLTIARDKTLARLEESVAQIRWGSGGKHRALVKDGLIVAVFRHYESRAGKPLLHDHAVVSIKARRPDGKWGNVSTADILDNIVAAGTLYTLYFMEEVSARLGWAWEPREVTHGKRPVMEIAGIDQRLIGWQSTRRQQIADVMPAIEADYEDRQGHQPGERAGYALDQQAADRTRPPKRKEARSLSELREQWRASAIQAVAELLLRERLPDHLPHRPDDRGEIPDWVADRHALTHPDTPEHWRHHLAERHRILARSLADRGHTLAPAPPAWARPLGPPPPHTALLRRAAWSTTCALVELWRTRHAITAMPGLGPRPAHPDDATAWDDLDARVRALTGRRRPVQLPPADAPASVVLEATLSHLNTPPDSGALPDHPALRAPGGIAPLNYTAWEARLARDALAAVLGGDTVPEAWMEEITAPGEDDEDEQRTYIKLLTAISDYRRRHHQVGPDVLGPRPQGLGSEEWDLLTDAMDLYTRARVGRRLEQMRVRTVAARAAVLPPTSPLRQPPAPGSHRPHYQRPPNR
ncbi:MobF family relaxase [Streptomyces sp. NPDC005077]|uniref:MobF family relaxase n=1 Tax=Streptomyces sp. NPDC005077 TaxID=3154292 RepID=UPI0033BAAE8B